LRKVSNEKGKNFIITIRAKNIYKNKKFIPLFIKIEKLQKDTEFLILKIEN
jgi:hypothetical protein